MDSVKKTFNSWDERAKEALTPKTKLSLPVKDKRLEDLLLWRSPSQSAAVLGGVTLGFWVLNVVAYSPVVVLATVAQFGVLACFLINVAAGFLKKPGVPVPAFISEGISEAEAKDIATRYTVYINKLLALIERVISGKDVVLTLQVAGSLFVVSKVAAVVSPLTLTWLGVVSLFTLPKLYELKKEEIDAQVGKARQQYNNVYDKHIDKLWKKIPKASTAASPTATPAKTPTVAEQAEGLAKEARSAVDAAGGKKLF